LPRLALSTKSLKALGGGVFELEVTVVNEGFLPTAPKMGELSKHVAALQVELKLPPGASLVTGHPRHAISRLTGSGGHESVSWLILAAEGVERKVTVDVRSPSVGSSSLTVELK
jgi:hypothetical protein